jgi:hypothetical protein
MDTHRLVSIRKLLSLLGFYRAKVGFAVLVQFKQARRRSQAGLFYYTASTAFQTVTAFELQSIVVHPAHDGSASHRQTALRYHLRQIAVTEFETQVPAHPKDDDLPVKVAALERLIETQEPGHRTVFSLSAFSLSGRPDMGGRIIRARAVSGRIHHCELVNHAGDVMPFRNKK